MYRRSTAFLTVSGVFLFANAATLTGCPMDTATMGTYRITIENLSDAQPIAPIVAAAHDRSFVLFRVGQTASDALIPSAEDGDPAPLMTLLDGNMLVTDVHNVGMPLTRRGTTVGDFTDSATFNLQAQGDDLLSLAGMMIATNDGFTGVDSTGFPVMGTKVVYTVGYDAGSENNTEMSADIPDPASALGPVALPNDPDGNDNATPDTNPRQPITLHPNIQGGADLTVEDHAWTDPILRVSITRLQ